MSGEILIDEVLDSLTSHIAVLNSKGEIVSVNQAWKHFSRENSAESSTFYVGTNYLTVCKAAVLGGDEAAEEVLRGLHAILSGKQDNFLLEYPCNSPTEERWFTVRATRFSNETGAYVVVAHDNITSRKQFKEELLRTREVLRESEEKYRDLVEHSEELIGIHDMDGTILSVNPATVKQLGYSSQEEVIGRNMAEFLSPDVRDKFGAYLTNLRQGSSGGLMKVLTRQGQERVWEFRNSIRSEGVEKPLVRAMANDITDRIRAERELRETQKLQSVLYRIADAASSASDLQGLYSAIHKSVSVLVNANNFYIALYDPSTETVTFPFHIDDFDPDWEPRTKRKGLTEYVIRTGKALLVTPEVFDALLRAGEVDVVISNRIDWIGVPLRNSEGTFGMLGVHSYSREVRFTPRDMEVLMFVSQQVAAAIERKQAQEKHKQAEARFRQVVELAPSSIVMTDQGGKIVLANSTTEKLFGYQRDELLKMGIEDLVPRRYRESHAKERVDFVADGRSRAMGTHRDLYALQKNGVEIPVEIGLNPIQWGQENFVLAAIFDISERKKTEREMAERERLSRFGADVGDALTRGDTLPAKLQQCAEALIRTLGEGIASVWTLSPETQMLELQASAGKQESIPSSRKQVSVGESWIGIVARDREPLLIDLMTATAKKEDATWARDAGMVSFAGYPLVFEDSLVGVLSVFSSNPQTPVSLLTMASVADEIAIGIQSAAASEALKHSEEKYRLLAERIPAITYITEFGQPGRWHYVSSQLQHTLGFTPEEWLADPGIYWKQVHPQDSSRILALEKECEKTQARFVSEYRMLSRNGNTVWIHDEGTVIEDKLYQGFMVDITERKRIEGLKDELTSVVAHELRTPLTSILGSLEYLNSQDNQLLNEQEKKLLDIATRNSQRMLRLINDLLDMDKLESGKTVFDVKPVNLVQTVQDMLDANQPYAAQFGVKLLLVETLPRAIVLAEPERLMQVMTNLLSNAAKFSPQSGLVEVKLSKSSKAFRVGITDHGAGIDENFRCSIFQKFAQAETDRTRRGSGLGLSISKAIIEKLGGTIGFDTRVGFGTTFYFELPQAQ